MSIEYHDPESCNWCSRDNFFGKEVFDHDIHTLCEAETACKFCGFKDYWAYGFFESSILGYNNCKKYTNRFKT